MASSKKPQKAQPNRLLTWDEVEPWQRENDFIVTGYRPVLYTYAKTLASVFEIHNETTNIWTHLIGAVLMAAGLVFVFRTNDFSLLTTSFDVHTAFLILYTCCVLNCFVSSTLFHTFMSHTEGVYDVVNRIDHVGITMCLWGAGMSAAHFAFYCHDTIRLIYFTLLTASATSCIVFTFQERFRGPAGRGLRFLTYSILGLTLFVSTGHAMWRFGLETTEEMMGTRSYWILGFSNLAAALIYISRFPERWYPVRFDIFGQSHNWLHIFPIGGAIVRLIGLLDVIERWRAKDAAMFCAALEH